MPSDWLTTLSLIFGGCCSNAISLEQITSTYPDSGSLITFFQFLLISLYGLPKQITLSSSRIPYPRLRARKIPLTPYLIQVGLFYAVSLLNNAAFGYHIPMPVHIIFRSGGLIVGMVLGRVIAGKRYTLTQIISVIVVTLGVVTTTLSASRPKSKSSIPSDPSLSSPPIYFTPSYAMGIIILSVALIFAGLLGLVQDWTFSQYRRPSGSTKNPHPANGHVAHLPKENGFLKPKAEHINEIPTWQESMFYLHFLAMPLFLFVWKDLVAQFRAVHSGPRIDIPLSLAALYQSNPALSYPLAYYAPKDISPSSLSIPTAYFPLLLNTLTQLLCASGVHRLTGKVSSLTVTLTLVVRKAVSLVISVLLYGGDGKGNVKMWVGAVFVLAGTVGYSMGGMKGAGNSPKQVVKVGKENKEKAE